MKKNNQNSNGIDKFQSPLSKMNFILIAVSIAMIVLGYILMSGSPNSLQEYNPDIFSTRRIVVGPTISFLGFICMGVAIIYRKRK
ncbi:MAG: DUF3098 domain-containing protein [Bacteroidales bacterium]